MVVAKVWQLVRRPQGQPCMEDFKLVEENLPACGEGEVLVEAVALSIDPYLRYMARSIPLNAAMCGSQVAKVIESRNPDWPKGSYMVNHEGWRSHTVMKPDPSDPKTRPLPDMGDLPKSLGVGILGMPGNTAYFGLLDICNPKAGDTVLVNGAAGAVGSVVIQIAKIKGCTVIAFAGSEEKVSWVKELGADHVFNYKTTDIGDALSKTAPNGINIYFDNVGGRFSSEVIPHMAEFGRVSVCGAISTYNDDAKQTGAPVMSSPYNEAALIWKQLRIEGFVSSRWNDRWMEGINQLKEWIQQGKIKPKETVFNGFEKMPSAFIGLFSGENIGKAVVLP